MGYKFLYSINGDSNYVMYDSEDVEKTVVEDFEKAWIYMKSGEILKVEGSEQISRILCEMCGGRYVKELVLDHPQMYDVFQKIEDENSFYASPAKMKLDRDELQKQIHQMKQEVPMWGEAGP